MSTTVDDDGIERLREVVREYRAAYERRRNEWLARAADDMRELAQLLREAEEHLDRAESARDLIEARS